jgi:hypothetical protein
MVSSFQVRIYLGANYEIINKGVMQLSHNISLYQHIYIQNK